MMKFKNLVCAAAMTLGLTVGAQASSFTPGLTFTPNVDNNFTFTFTFGPKVADEDNSIESDFFGVGFDFDLTILGVTGDNPLVGYFIDGPDGRLTNETTCSGFGGVGNCDLVFAAEEDGQQIFADLPAGLYNFGVFGGPVSSEGSITFGVVKVAAVPLPAAGLLLLGGLGALGLKKRRRRQTA